MAEPLPYRADVTWKHLVGDIPLTLKMYVSYWVNVGWMSTRNQIYSAPFSFMTAGVNLDASYSNKNLLFSRRYLDPNRVTYEVQTLWS